MTRRTFVLSTAALAADAQIPKAPWYRRVVRWGQTNINERDPVRYDIPWWRAHWKRTEVQGVIVNAGGIVKPEARRAAMGSHRRHTRR